MSTPKQYRKKPVVIEAIQFTGGPVQAGTIIGWALPRGGTIRWHEEWVGESEPFSGQVFPEELRVETLEGTMRADVGDWIIRGVNGEFYPCKPDIFAKTYEEVA